MWLLGYFSSWVYHKRILYALGHPILDASGCVCFTSQAAFLCLFIWALLCACNGQCFVHYRRSFLASLLLIGTLVFWRRWGQPGVCLLTSLSIQYPDFWGYALLCISRLYASRGRITLLLACNGSCYMHFERRDPPPLCLQLHAYWVGILKPNTPLLVWYLAFGVCMSLRYAARDYMHLEAISPFCTETYFCFFYGVMVYSWLAKHLSPLRVIPLGYEKRYPLGRKTSHRGTTCYNTPLEIWHPLIGYAFLYASWDYMHLKVISQDVYCFCLQWAVLHARPANC